MKQALALMLAALLTIMTLTACASAPAESKNAADPAAQAPAWTGEITFFAQAYTPKKPDAVNPNPPTMLQTYADEFAAKNPGVTIKFVELAGDAVVSEWMRTQAAAKQLPDVCFTMAEHINRQYPTAMFQPLDDYFAKETPYVPGTKWGDTFNDAVMQMTQVGDGKHYVVSADYVETGIYYNKSMFEKAGITETPKNWEEFIAVCDKLKGAGITPLAWSMAQDDTYSQAWTNRVFLSNFYADKLSEIDVDGMRGINSMEQVIALKNGVVSVDDGKYLGYFDVLKNLTPYMNEGWASKSDLEKKFMQEEVAMYWTGSWLPKKMKDAGVTFEYSSFPFPTPTKETYAPYSTDAVTSGAVGGPSGGFQYVVTSEQANKTMSPEKMEIIIDWLMYITEPSRVTEIVKEQGSFCPTVKGSVPAEGMEELMANLNADYVTYDGGQNITGVSGDTMFRYLHTYMLGEITMEECVTKLSAMMEEEADALIEKNPDWEIEKYLK